MLTANTSPASVLLVMLTNMYDSEVRGRWRRLTRAARPSTGANAEDVQTGAGRLKYVNPVGHQPSRAGGCACCGSRSGHGPNDRQRQALGGVDGDRRPRFKSNVEVVRHA